MVERRIKDALKDDRARIQLGHISHFGLLEMSRQRLRPSLAETNFVPCPHCGGSGHMRSTESSAIHVLRAMEEECGKLRGGQILVHMASSVAMYLLNHKRDRLSELEARFVMRVHLASDDSLPPPQIRVERVKTALTDAERPTARPMVPAAPMEAEALDDEDVAEIADEAFEDETASEDEAPAEKATPRAAQPEGEKLDEAGRPRRRRRRGRGARRDESGAVIPEASGEAEAGETEASDTSPEIPSDTRVEGDTGEQPSVDPASLDENGLPKARRRGRRGGRRRHRDGTIDDGTPQESAPEAEAVEAYQPAYVGPTPADPYGGARPFDIYDLMDEELPPLDIPPVPEVTPQPEPHVEPSTARAADLEPAPPAEPKFEPQPEPPLPEETPEPVVAHRPEPEPKAPEPETLAEPPPAPVYAPVLVGAGDAAPAEPKRGWWRR